MGTVGKAIFLLEQFSTEQPEYGLSDLAQKVSFDKATTRRLLVSLAEHGMVEQDAETRRYRLGPGVSRLARIREWHFPLQKMCAPFVRDLARETGETVHLSEYSAGTLLTVQVELSARANRVNVDVGQPLPLHGTASGIAFLTCARPEITKACFEGRMEAFTRFTHTSRDALEKAVNAARARGYSRGDQGFEEGVASVAAPILNTDGIAIGTLAVASPMSRIDAETTERYGRLTMQAAEAIACQLNGGAA
ncbi:MAG: IclR family transcriptional regulator [Rhizobiaceae bacterium]|nr:IclR family transcriptional regulator [Rhizobiaceae bacterium]